MAPPERIWPAEFCIITAFNPNGQVLDEPENLRRNEQLRVKLEHQNLPFIDIIGASPDRQHQEHSFAVALETEAALDLARAFQQLAIYHVFTDDLSLIYCDSQEAIPLGSFRSRLHPLTSD